MLLRHSLISKNDMDLKKGHYVNGGKIKRPWEQLMSQASPTNKALANMDSYSQNILNDGYIDIVDIDTDMDMDGRWKIWI